MATVQNDLPLCTFYGNECFNAKFHNQTYKSQHCQCLPACNEVRYKYYIDRQRKFTSEEIHEYCQLQKPHNMYIWHYEKINFDVARLKNLTASEHEHMSAVCEKYLSKQFARVHVRPTGMTHLRRIQSLKYSSTDKFAIIGGTFGLFTGFSFIALFEALHWILVTVFKLFYLRKNQEDNVDPTDLKIQNLEKKLLEMEKNESKQNEVLSRLESIVKNLSGVELTAKKRRNDSGNSNIEESLQEVVVENIE